MVGKHGRETWSGNMVGNVPIVVGEGRFELPTACSQSRNATKLRHSPVYDVIGRQTVDPSRRTFVMIVVFGVANASGSKWTLHARAKAYDRHIVRSSQPDTSSRIGQRDLLMSESSSPASLRQSSSGSLLSIVVVFVATFAASLPAVRNWTDVKIAVACAVVLAARGPRAKGLAAILGAGAGHIVWGAKIDVGNWPMVAWVIVAAVAALEIAALIGLFGGSIASAGTENPVRRFVKFLGVLSIVAVVGGVLESWLLARTNAAVSASTTDIVFGVAIAGCLAAIALTRRGAEWLTSARAAGAELLAPFMVVLVTLTALQVTRQVWVQRDDDRLDVLARSVSATLITQWDRELEVFLSSAKVFAPALVFDQSALGELIDPYLSENDVAVAAALVERVEGRPTRVIERVDDGSVSFEIDEDVWSRDDGVVRLMNGSSPPIVIRSVEIVPLPDGGQLDLLVAFSLAELVRAATDDVVGRFDDVAVILLEQSESGFEDVLVQGEFDEHAERVLAGSLEFGAADVFVAVVPTSNFGAPGLWIALAVEFALGSLLGGILLLAANTEFKMTQERRRRENLLEAALDATPGISVVFDANLKVLAANRPIRQEYEREIPGLDVVRIFGLEADGGRRRLVEDLLRAALGGSPGNIEIAEDDRSGGEESASSPGRMRIVELSAYPVVSPGGEPVGFLHSVDATERRSLAMRSAQSERMESLGALAGGLAHDFNNLLFVTLGNLQLMAMNDAVVRDEKLSKFVSRSMSAVERGAEITKSLLAVARSQPLEESTVSLSDLVKGILPLVRQALGAGRRVEVDIPDPNVQLMVDSGRLSSCILNLAFNARDAMGPNGCLRISARLDESGEMVELSVADDGNGMPEDVVARAFEPFFTTKSPGSGTGLGLATVYAFAKQSGGTAFLESHLGAGTTVTLVLPRFSGEVVRSGAALARRSGRRVVVADDEQALAEMVAAWLIDMGIDARFAMSPKAALEMIEEFEPDVLVSDANFGEELDGIELARLGTAIMPDMAVVFMTGYSTSMRELQELGERTLAKPFSREDLYAALSPLIAEEPSDVPASNGAKSSGRKKRRPS